MSACDASHVIRSYFACSCPLNKPSPTTVLMRTVWVWTILVFRLFPGSNKINILVVLDELGIETAGTEFDPDGKEEYVCFRDPVNIQVGFYVWEYED